jgi:transcription antitermination factor NusA-like protein
MILMAGTISMQDMRHLNLFRRITGISTRYVIKYNEMIIFCVPKKMVSRAIGPEARNIRKIGEILGRRIKVIPIPQGIEHVKEFIKAIVAPVEFKDLEIKDNEIILTAGSRSKAALLGRNKRRLLEMQKIIKDFFGKDFKII